MIRPDQYHTKSSDADERALSVLRELLREARTGKYTGQKQLLIDFSNGGIRNIRYTVEKSQ